MSEFRLAATAAFGLESVVAHELKRLGLEKSGIDNGRISFSGTERDVARANIWLRCADRVLVEMGRFPATDFEELFQGVLKVPWGDILPRDAAVHVTGRSVRSKLSSVPACQSVVKKAIIESLKGTYHSGTFPETGPRFGVEVSLNRDVATIDMDSTGPGLHKRGYRSAAGEAALKETLAAGLVYLSRWKPGIALADPFCGSGTIAIEAAMMGRNIAPGTGRQFAAEQWPFITSRAWDDVRRDARGAANREDLHIVASDIDDDVMGKARRNARHTGVLSAITFRKGDFRELSLPAPQGIVICNPPYGERSGDRKTAAEQAGEMGRLFGQFPAWSFFILTAFEGFEKHYGKRADRNRKLYNGRIQCYLYEYGSRFKVSGFREKA
ncbi:MAG: Ribosomal RNA large subunit methyltransferase K [Syntrophorhabdus sp. PtaB.Bin047]|jgi:putative N6-adenine-specific DNA methylase|nr:MAG: Ribosomal RNA large subunit methyltransferase K [Syntrophorhabdus sp. PtaB.Bin047]